MESRPCIVLIDPSTGLSTFVRACDAADVGLIVISTESSRRYPGYFERPAPAQVELALSCAAADVPARIAALAADYPLLEICAGDEAAVALAERANYSLHGRAANDPSTVACRVSKYEMHRALQRRGMPTPRQARFELSTVNAADLHAQLAAWTFPVIVKPQTCAGSVCTYRVENRRALASTLERARVEARAHALSDVSRHFLVQEFVTGPEFLVNTVSIDGRHHVTGVYSYSKFTNFGVPIYQSVNDDGLGDRESAIADYVATVLDALGVRRGLFNTDLIDSPDGPRLLEVNARIVGFGGSLSRLEHHLRGNDQASALLRLLGLDGRGSGAGRTEGETRRRGKVVLLQNRFDRPMCPPNDDALRGLGSYVEHRWWKAPGEPLRRARSYLHDTVGYALLAHAEPDVLQGEFAALVDRQDEGSLF